MLQLVVVQDGYVRGEAIHSELEADVDNYLHARVTGDILTQYQINVHYVDEDSLSLDVLNALPISIISRQLIRVKRVRSLSYINGGDGSSWNINREYRMVLENWVLYDSVGIPNNQYGSGDATTIFF